MTNPQIVIQVTLDGHGKVAALGTDFKNLAKSIQLASREANMAGDMAASAGMGRLNINAPRLGAGEMGTGAHSTKADQESVGRDMYRSELIRRANLSRYGRAVGAFGGIMGGPLFSLTTMANVASKPLAALGIAGITVTAGLMAFNKVMERRLETEKAATQAAVATQNAARDATLAAGQEGLDFAKSHRWQLLSGANGAEFAKLFADMKKSDKRLDEYRAQNALKFGTAAMAQRELRTRDPALAAQAEMAQRMVQASEAQLEAIKNFVGDSAILGAWVRVTGKYADPNAAAGAAQGAVRNIQGVR